MQSTRLDVPIGSCYIWTCECGAELRASGPIHMQPTVVECPCGAAYLCHDEGEVKVLRPGVAPEPEPEKPAPAKPKKKTARK